MGATYLIGPNGADQDGFAHYSLDHGCPGSTGAVHRAFEQRIFYAYEHEPGYPRNTVTPLTETASFSTTDITVVDEQGRVPEEMNGWYRIPAGATIAIEKSVTTPTVTVYDDQDVADLVSFRSYTPRRLDQSLMWEIDQTLNLTRTHDTGFAQANAMTAVEATAGQGVSDYEVTR